MIPQPWKLGPKRTLTNNPYVSDGLVAMWDGIWNVGNGSKRHDSSLHVWRDCVGGGIPIVAPSYGAYFTDNGLYSNSQIGASAGRLGGPIVGGPVGGDDGYAWVFHELVFEIPEFRSATSRLVMCCGKRILAWLHVSTSSVGMTVNRGQSLLFPGLDFSQTPVAMCVSVSYGGTSLTDLDGQRMWFNGVENGTGSGYYDSWSNVWMHPNMIGNLYNGTPNYSVPITYHSIRFYDRVLTQDEIDANHAADVERFNLGGGSEWLTPGRFAELFSRSAQPSVWRVAA